MTRHLVTGCAGFIGSHLAASLLDDGRTVVGIDEVNDAYDPTIKKWRLDRLQQRDGFTFHQADIAEEGILDQVVPEPATIDTIYNLAARAGVRQSVQDPWTYLHTNATGHLNVLEWARRHDIGTVLLASTSSLYGEHNQVPFQEDADTDHPLSPYAASKKAAEAMTASYAHLHGLDTPICRYFTVYGPAGRPDMSIFRFVRWIVEGEAVQVYGDGEQRRDFTYVDDIVAGTRLAAEKIQGYDVVNLGNDEPHSLNEMIQLIEKTAGKDAQIEYGERAPADVDATWADIDKARRSLGWEPQVGLAQGLERCVEWYMEERDWAEKVALGAV